MKNIVNSSHQRWKPALAGLVVLLTCTCVLAQYPVNLETVRKSVVFIYAADNSGRVNTNAPIGTGFLISVPLKSNPSRAYYLLVTARHIVEPVWACLAQQNPSRLYVRLNKLKFDPSSDNEGTDYIPIAVNSIGKNLTAHTNIDPSVDAAVVTLNSQVINSQTYDISLPTLDNFATPDELKTIDSGVEVLSAGMLPVFPGVRRNYPIFKFGHISAIPKERIQISCGNGREPLRLWLWFVAANLVAGNSGSPFITVPRQFSGVRASIIGLQSYSFNGSDVSGMTPVQYIYEIIEQIGLPDADLTRGPKQEPKQEQKKP